MERRSKREKEEGTADVPILHAISTTGTVHRSIMCRDRTMSALLVTTAVSICCLAVVASAFTPTRVSLLSARDFIVVAGSTPPSAEVLLHSSPSPSDVEEEARKLRELASQLRGEVSDFELAKDEVVAAELAEKNKIIEEKQQVRMRYSAEVPILKGDGQTVMERVDFPPRIPDGESVSYF